MKRNLLVDAAIATAFFLVGLTIGVLAAGCAQSQPEYPEMTSAHADSILAHLLAIPAERWQYAEIHPLESGIKQAPDWPTESERPAPRKGEAETPNRPGEPTWDPTAEGVKQDPPWPTELEQRPVPKQGEAETPSGPPGEPRWDPDRPCPGPRP